MVSDGFFPDILMFNVWSARGVRWKLIRRLLPRPCGATVEAAESALKRKTQTMFRLFEKSRPSWRPRSAGLCAGVTLFLSHAGCQEQAGGKTGTWQTEMQLPAGDEDHPVGAWTFPDDSRGCLWWMSQRQVSFKLFAAIMDVYSKPATRWRKGPVLPARPGEFGKI